MNLGVVVLASAALLVTGCGGSASPGVAHLSNTSGGSTANTGGKFSSPESAASTQQKMVAYSQCMRTHGVPGFPNRPKASYSSTAATTTGNGPESTRKSVPVPDGAEGLRKATCPKEGFRARHNWPRCRKAP